MGGRKSFLTSFQFSFIFISIVAIWIHNLIFLKIKFYILTAQGNGAGENFKKVQTPFTLPDIIDGSLKQLKEQEEQYKGHQ